MNKYVIKIIGIILVSLLGLLTYYKNTKNIDEIPNYFNKVIYVIIFLTLIINITDVYQSRYVEREFWHKGEIHGSVLESPAFKIGTAKFIPSGELETLFNLTGDPIKVWTYDGKLQLFTIVRNQKGEQMVSVIGNDFVVNPNTVSDFNYDDDALEVLDKKGDVVLQIQMQKDGVLFCGKFYLKDGRRFGIGNNIIEIEPEGKELELNFERIFIYPGKNNLGVRR